MTVPERDGQITGLVSPLLERLRLRAALPWVPAEAAVLDVGCGRARLLAHRRPSRYVGLDVITGVLEANRRRHPEHEFHRLDVEVDDLDHLGVFDVVVMLAVIEHVARPGAVLARLRRLLAPGGGRIVLTTPHPRGERVLALGARAGLCSPEAHDEHHGLLDRAGLAARAAESGLRVQAYRAFLLGMNQLAVLG